MSEVPRPELSILIVTFNCASDAARCLRSIRENVRDLPWEILIRDNASSDAAEVAALAGDRVRVELGRENIGFGRANNELATLARGEFLVCLNPDTILRDDALSPLVAHLKVQKAVGAVCPILYNADGSLQDAWGLPADLWWEFCETHYLQGVHRRRAWRRMRSLPAGKPWDVGFVSGACLCMRTDVFRSIGGFDPAFFLNHEDVELCDRIRSRGLAVQILPWAGLIHCEGTTQRRDWRAYARNRLVGKWIYLARRYSGWKLLVARGFWWEAVVWKWLAGGLLLRGDARGRLSGYVDAARKILDP